jgi:hypothetical protein
MRHHGIRAIMARPRRVRTTDSCHDLPIAPNLLDRNFTHSLALRPWRRVRKAKARVHLIAFNYKMSVDSPGVGHVNALAGYSVRGDHPFGRHHNPCHCFPKLGAH